MMAKKMTVRSLRAQKTKKKLFQSAAKLMDKYGYENVTIEDICRKAGVSIGAFYHYYNSKSDIIMEVFKQIDYYFEEMVAPGFTDDAVANIKTFFHHYAQFHVNQGYGHTSMVVKIQNSFFLDKSRYIHIKLNELVASAKTQGAFISDENDETIADFFLVVARGMLFDWSLARGEYDLIEKMDAYIGLAISSFAIQ